MRPTLDAPWIDTGTHACEDCGAETRDAVCAECGAERDAATRRDDIAHHLACCLERYRIDGHAPGLAKAVEEAVEALRGRGAA